MKKRNIAAVMGLVAASLFAVTAQATPVTYNFVPTSGPGTGGSVSFDTSAGNGFQNVALSAFNFNTGTSTYDLSQAAGTGEGSGGQLTTLMVTVPPFFNLTADLGTNTYSGFFINVGAGLTMFAGNFIEATSVPEPGVLGMFGAGVLLIGGALILDKKRRGMAAGA